jgi:hypothetical protein
MKLLLKFMLKLVLKLKLMMKLVLCLHELDEIVHAGLCVQLRQLRAYGVPVAVPKHHGIQHVGRPV